MSRSTAAAAIKQPPAAMLPNLDKQIGKPAKVAFVLTLLAGIGFAGFSLSADMNSSGEAFAALLPYFLLASALLVALGFEFVNGFHDTANAVATVIYILR